MEDNTFLCKICFLKAILRVVSGQPGYRAGGADQVMRAASLLVIYEGAGRRAGRAPVIMISGN